MRPASWCFVLYGFFLQVVDIDMSILIAFYHYHFHSRHDGTGGVGAVCGNGDQHDVAVRPIMGA